MIYIKKIVQGAGDLALTVSTALAKNPNSIPGTHIRYLVVACNASSRGDLMPLASKDTRTIMYKPHTGT